ncbi:hypothetical protein [Mycobacterium mantenii]|uniref:restriction endonuclease n=1 Tax=Mycobacterium mantenii TaxID=560555 RepID=UPI0009EE6C3A|nr:hypothetical protein [Mycobacterium mantenii]
MASTTRNRARPNPAHSPSQFEHICQWWINDPVYKHELRHVWLWDEWRARWGGNAGMDLAAEDSTGKLLAIQAKGIRPRGSCAD